MPHVPRTSDQVEPAIRTSIQDSVYMRLMEYMQAALTLSSIITATLTEANPSGSWNTKEAYRLSGLYPVDWADFIERCKTNDTLLDLYYKYHMHVPRRLQIVFDLWYGKCQVTCTQHVQTNYQELRMKTLQKYNEEHTLC